MGAFTFRRTIQMRSAAWLLLFCVCFVAGSADVVPIVTTTAEALDAKPIQEAFEEEEAQAIKVAQTEHELQDGSWDEGIAPPKGEVEMNKAEAKLEDEIDLISEAPEKQKKEEVHKAMVAATKVAALKAKALAMEKRLNHHNSAPRSSAMPWTVATMLIAALLVGMH